MICCVVASFLIAQVVAVMRRWGIFWGLLKPRDYEARGTFLRWLGVCWQKPVVRGVVAGAMAFELALGGAWLISAHGPHLLGLSRSAFARTTIMPRYAQSICGHADGRRLAASDSVMRTAAFAKDQPKDQR